MGKLTLILGGARSGKSVYAERLAGQGGGSVTYIATAQAKDEEMAARIAQHQSKRSPNWQTLEIPLGVGAAWKAQSLQSDLVLLDCLTLLVSNIILDASPDADHPDEGAATARTEAEISQLLEAIQDSEASWIVVSNEVGMGLVPPYPLGRIYRDLLGWANQQLAARAEEVVFMIAGVAMRLMPA
jgi:adenosylcobinamide kinase/adenosylcobinamide-phosphate guanylyltransferase